MNASVKTDGVLLYDNLLLNQSVHLLLEEVALIDVVWLKLLEVFLQIGDVLDNLLQNVIRGLSRVMFERGALWS